MIFLHGFMGCAADWEYISNALSEDFYCVAPDLPGHGESIGLPNGAYTMEGAAREVVELMDGVGLSRANVAGYSMGGRLALYLALRYPERCAGLFLESASPGIEGEEERASRRGADEEQARRLESGDFEEFLRGWYAQPLFESLASHEGLVEKLITSRTNNAPHELAKSLRGMGTGDQPSLWGDLPNLKVPALAVAGGLDGKFTDIAHRMADSSQNMRAAVVPEAGHNVHAEQPGAYLALLRSFLERPTSRAG